ncbi:DNA-binding TFAR19-related protein [Hyaloscypha variabilis F]|uniref:DNA-binding TFAR19-related protein n=1 Tax=Hyaloscypha variabilis (strain UAMH 11265 / GT02V1 / F) TaxID=1149755 RepID=A0A2J6RKZ5_HYAVF|nr:DNA-binding TFAR19-related protein [Hyaloscypha variabilis F]
MEDDDLAAVEKLALSSSRRKVVEEVEEAAIAGQVEEVKKIDTEARQSILNQILEPEAADRLGRIRLVKESRAQDVENRLIVLARSGQLRQKVTEEQLKELLGAVAEGKEEAKIVVTRRKGTWDDEDDDLLDLE